VGAVCAWVGVAAGAQEVINKVNAVSNPMSKYHVLVFIGLHLSIFFYGFKNPSMRLAQRAKLDRVDKTDLRFVLFPHGLEIFILAHHLLPAAGGLSSRASFG